MYLVSSCLAKIFEDLIYKIPNYSSEFFGIFNYK